jgi:hypothetical protein
MSLAGYLISWGLPWYWVMLGAVGTMAWGWLFWAEHVHGGGRAKYWYIWETERRYAQQASAQINDLYDRAEAAVREVRRVGKHRRHT